MVSRISRLLGKVLPRTGPQRRRAAGLIGLLAVLFALATPLIGAAARPGYSHAAQFVSELGESGAMGGQWVSLLGFAPTGVLTLLFLALAAPALPRSRRTSLGLLSFGAVGAAYVVSAVSRCDAGCPSAGSFSQTVHNLFGVLEYVGAFAGLVLLGGVFHRSTSWRPLSLACFVCVTLIGVGFGGIFVPSLSPFRGVSQRIAEAGIFLWVALVSRFLLTQETVVGG